MSNLGYSDNPYRRIPVIINSRDIDPWPLVLDLAKAGAWRIYVIDNASTSPGYVGKRLRNQIDTITPETLGPIPCWRGIWLDDNLDDQLDTRVDEQLAEEFATHHAGRDEHDYYVPVYLLQMARNGGPRAACAVANALRGYWQDAGCQWYATTDGDLRLPYAKPWVLPLMGYTLQRYNARGLPFVKVGSALLPSTVEPHHWTTRETILFSHSDSVAISDHPSRFCPREIPAYLADIDTTLAVYPISGWDGSYGPSIRIAGECAAIHLPWLCDPRDAPSDQQHYLRHADPQGTVYTAAMQKEFNQQP